MRRLFLASMLLGASFAACLVACGSRTGLLLESEPVGMNPASDAGRDATVARDAARDALPLIDATPIRDVDRSDCPDADSTLVYLISTGNDLLSFDPSAASFRRIGKIACPSNGGATPFSMAVDRRGIAYILFSDGELYRVSTKTGACTSTPYRSNQGGITTFGMGFAADDDSPTERLYIASDNSTNVRGLAFIDDRFVLNPVAAFVPDIERAELTGTGDGRLFAFYSRTGLTSAAIGLVEKESGRVLAETPMRGVQQGNSWAFAFWGGDFYMFTAPGGSSIVTRFRPSNGSINQIATYTGGGQIVGAGVSTCAPQQ